MGSNSEEQEGERNGGGIIDWVGLDLLCCGGPFGTAHQDCLTRPPQSPGSPNNGECQDGSCKIKAPCQLIPVQASELHSMVLPESYPPEVTRQQTGLRKSDTHTSLSIGSVQQDRKSTDALHTEW